MSRYVPPRRESIEDHLRVILARSKALGIDPKVKPPTRAFVVDLIKKQIINGPVDTTRSQGAGRARRFLPVDYRDLLEVIKLRSRGVVHRSAWILHLWLRGHNYPFETVQAALIREIELVLELAERDLAPTGRYTEPFSEKYDRRIRQRPEEAAAPELIDIMEPLAAHMMRPSEMSGLQLNISGVVEAVSQVTDFDPGELLTALTDLQTSTQTGEPLPERAAAIFNRLFAAAMSEPLLTSLLTPSEGRAAPLQESATRSYALFSDGRGHSNLVEYAQNASAADFGSARGWFQLVRSGKMERFSELAIEAGHAGAADIATALPFARHQRLTIRQNPRFVPFFFASFLADEMAPKAIPATSKQPPDSRSVLNALRDAYASGNESGKC